jgi:hypothetical protein
MWSTLGWFATFYESFTYTRTCNDSKLQCVAGDFILHSSCPYFRFVKDVQTVWAAASIWPF